MATYSLEYRNYIATFCTGLDSATINKNGRSIQASHGNDATWHVFVAATDGDKAIKTLCTCHCFY